MEITITEHHAESHNEDFEPTLFEASPMICCGAVTMTNLQRRKREQATRLFLAQLLCWTLWGSIATLFIVSYLVTYH
jgi:hypothetical protein